jgi:transposase
MEKYKVTLMTEERRDLEQLLHKGKAATRKLAHARILLLADASEGRSGRTDGEIADVLAVGLRTISRVRKRFVTESLAEALHPRPQPGRPDKIKLSEAAEQQLLDLACSDPPDGRGSWTLQLLADQLVVLGQVDSVSRETIRQALKKMIFPSAS